ncbi:MAG: tRNA (N6-threonylcarbamoyladenosine(37)-N6)-methyltransferase TrmO [bacterium]
MELKPIGIIHSPYKNQESAPKQGNLSEEEATIEVFEEYTTGLKDIERCTHLIILFYFHKSKTWSLLQVPHLGDGARGVFTIRSPHRPNHIGFTVVRLLEKKDNILKIRGVDMLDGSPVIDIKPYISQFDSYDSSSL